MMERKRKMREMKRREGERERRGSAKTWETRFRIWTGSA